MTKWPLIWTVEPDNPNWEGIVGDRLYFTVSAIPDPEFEDGWDYGDDEDEPIPLPDEPEDIKFNVDGSNFDGSDYSFSGNTMTISVDDVVKFFPFTSIKFEKNGQVHQVHYETDLRSQGFDFVFEFIPNPASSLDVFISLRVTSTSETDLTGTFNFKIHNNFDSVREALKRYLSDGQEFLSSLAEGDGTPAELDDPEDEKVETVIPTFNGKYIEPNYDELFPNAERSEIDKYIRSGDMDEVEKRIGNGSGLKKTPKSPPTKNTLGTANPDDDDLSDWFDNLGE